MHDLSTATAATTTVDPEKLRVALRDAQVDAIFDQERMHEREGRRDLVAIGATAIAALLTALVFGRA